MRDDYFVRNAGAPRRSYEKERERRRWRVKRERAVYAVAENVRRIRQTGENFIERRRFAKSYSTVRG